MAGTVQTAGVASPLTRTLTCALPLIAVASTGVGGAVPAVAAAQRGSVGVAVGSFDPKVPGSMSHFILTLAPGATYANDVIVTNPNNAPSAVDAYPADAGTSNASGEYYGSRSDPLRKAGAWVTSSVTSLTLPVKGRVRVPFVVRVPPDATPGDHLAAMVFEPVSPENGPGEMGVNAIWRVAMPILVQVPGPGSFHIVLNGASIQPREGTHTATVVVSLANDGNRKGKPSMSIRLIGPNHYDRTEPVGDCFAHADGRFCGNLDYVLPGDTIGFPFPWTQDLAAGDYTIVVTGRWGTGADERTVLTVRDHLAAPLLGTSLMLSPHSDTTGVDTGHGGFWGFLRRLGIKGLLIALLLVTALFAPLVLKRRRCTHCGRRGLLGMFTVQDYHELAGCPNCRRKARDRVRVVLCQTCYRTHVRTALVDQAEPAG